MLLTIEQLFNEPSIVKAVIDRTMLKIQDEITWQRYLTPNESPSETFKTYFGTTSQVAAGSMINRYGRKPLRTRKNIGDGTGEVGSFGDAFQMDNYRLDRLLALIKKFNNEKSENGQKQALDDIVNYIVDDYREVLMAPMMAINRMLGDARSRAKYHVDINGSDGRDIKLPIRTETATAAQMKNIGSWIREIIKKHREFGNYYSVMQMTETTFHNKFVKSEEFVGTFSLDFGKTKISPANIITADMANQLLEGAGIKVKIELVDEAIILPDGKPYEAFADNVISLLPQYDLGTLEYYKSNEWSDPVPNKVYTEAHNGAVLISSQRTDEGRFLEYLMNAAPNLTIPHKMGLLKLV